MIMLIASEFIYRNSGIWNESSSSSIFAENENGTGGMAVCK